MIIKPAADGNLVLQDRAGNTRLQTDAAGVTITAPTIASMANCTFPAGHVIQTTLPTRAATMTIGGSEDPTWTDSVVASTITPKFSNSSIICCINIQAWFGGETSGDMGYGFRLKKAGTGVSNTYGSPLFGPIIQAEGHSIYYRNSPTAGPERQHTHYFSLYDNNCETTNTITYTMQYTTYNMDHASGGNAMRIGGNPWDNFQWNMFFHEIKR